MPADGGARKQRQKISVRRGRIREFLESEVYSRLDPQRLYDHAAHLWKHDSAESLKGGCPWHDSKSGSSFVVTKSNLLWWCAG